MKDKLNCDNICVFLATMITIMLNTEMEEGLVPTENRETNRKDNNDEHKTQSKDNQDVKSIVTTGNQQSKMIVY